MAYVYSTVTAQMKIGTGSFQTIPQVMEISEAPKAENGTIEVTALNDSAKQYIPERLKDTGNFNFVYNIDSGSAVHSYIESASYNNNGRVESFKLQFPDKAFEFSGSFVNYGRKITGPNDVLKAEVGVKVTGQPTIS